MNSIQIVGRVGQDPVFRQESTYCLASLSVATTERGYTLQNGMQVPDRTDWHRIRVTGKTAEFVRNYVKKGHLVSVVGSLHYEKYEDRQGITREKAVVRADRLWLLTSRSEGSNQAQQKENDQLPFDV